MKAQRESGGLALLSLTRWGWLTPRLGRFTSGKETRYPLHRTLGGPQVWKGAENLISIGIRTPDRQARNK